AHGGRDDLPRHVRARAEGRRREGEDAREDRGRPCQPSTATQRSPIMTIEAVNLDALSVEEVEQAAMTYQLLAGYAAHKAQAMRWRLDGKISSALREEQKCEAIYAELPAETKW